MKIYHTVAVVTALVLNVIIVTAEKDFPALDHIVPSASPATQTQAALDLIKRLVPQHVDKFTVSVDPSIGPKFKDTFKIMNGASGQRPIQITGTTGVGVAMGFYYYIKKYCNAQISWAGDQVNLPDNLPMVPEAGVTITSNDRFRYYQNVCTVSYSMVWWNYTRWQKEIDWMAMTGINFPLAFNGQEGIWNKVYLKMGFTQAELDAHFSGPAFFAWQRMGNMEGWGGPLSSNWHEQQTALQHQILTGMRSLGMIPILPAFAGHVPKAITRLFPKANVSHLRNWGHFTGRNCCTTFLEPTDPYFKQIGKAFLDEYIKEFDTDHVYNCDSFNEMTPRSSDPAYLRGAGSGVYAGMLASDPKAIWVMQGWLFLSGFWKPPQAKALLTSVPTGHMIILDLNSELRPIYPKFESYYGQPFIWNMLHDFGGTLPMYGDIESINTGPFRGRSFPNSTMIGIGLTPEGINQNDVIYEFMMENTWRKEPENLTAWFNNYGARRYGKSDANVDKAWQLLMSSVYNCTTGYWDFGSGVTITRTPEYTTERIPAIWYDPDSVFEAWDYFIQAAGGFTDSVLFRYDLVDVSRQSLQLISTMIYHNALISAKAKDKMNFQKNATLFLGLMDDLETLLQTDVHFLMGRWIADARALGTNDMEKNQYEMNARNQVTMWGPTGNILDYANKQWAGLVKYYYKPRWELFFTQVSDSLTSGKPFSQPAYDADVLKTVEQPFTYDRTVIPPTPSGDQIEVAKSIHTKYRPATMRNKEYFTNLYEQYKLNSDKGDEESWNGLSYEMGRKHEEVKPAHAKVNKFWGKLNVHNEILKTIHQLL